MESPLLTTPNATVSPGWAWAAQPPYEFALVLVIGVAAVLLAQIAFRAMLACRDEAVELLYFVAIGTSPVMRSKPRETVGRSSFADALRVAEASHHFSCQPVSMPSLYGTMGGAAVDDQQPPTVSRVIARRQDTARSLLLLRSTAVSTGVASTSRALPKNAAASVRSGETTANRRRTNSTIVPRVEWVRRFWQSPVAQYHIWVMLLGCSTSIGAFILATLGPAVATQRSGSVELLILFPVFIFYSCITALLKVFLAFIEALDHRRFLAQNGSLMLLVVIWATFVLAAVDAGMELWWDAHQLETAVEDASVGVATLLALVCVWLLFKVNRTELRVILVLFGFACGVKIALTSPDVQNQLRSNVSTATFVCIWLAVLIVPNVVCEILLLQYNRG